MIEVKLIHLSEINTIIIDTTAATMTSYLISEMLSRKIKIIICDKKRNPQGEIVSYYGSHNTSEQIFKQIKWDDYCEIIWTRIIEEKIINQANFLKELNIENYQMLYDYVGDLVYLMKVIEKVMQQRFILIVYLENLLLEKINVISIMH